MKDKYKMAQRKNKSCPGKGIGGVNCKTCGRRQKNDPFRIALRRKARQSLKRELKKNME